MKKITAIILLAALLLVSGCRKSGSIVLNDLETQLSTASQPQTEPQTEDTTISTSTVETTMTEAVIPVALETTTVAESVDFAEPEENAITITAQSLLGIPFAEGGANPQEGFDNSGFIQYVLIQNGFLNTPHRVSEQAEMGDKIQDMQELHSGDLVFFSTGGTRAEYGGIYIGDGIMIYSPQPGDVVKEQSIVNDYWRSTFFVGIRVL